MNSVTLHRLAEITMNSNVMPSFRTDDEGSLEIMIDPETGELTNVG